MPNEITAAFIGAGGGIVAACVPQLLKAISIRQSKHLSARRNALLGRWEGQAEDYYVEDSRRALVGFSATMVFTTAGHTVRAEAIIWSATDTVQDDLVLSGTFYNDDYLQLSYCNKNFARKQLGVVVLGLGPDGQTLSGSYTGFSPRRDTIIAGTISLSKKT